MACKTYEDLIDKYIEGLVTIEEKDILDRHMEVCPECRKEVKELRQVIKEVSSLGQVELPPNLAPSLMEKIKSIAPKQKPVDKSSRLASFLRDISAFISNYYYNNKRAFIAVMSVLLIGIFVVTVYNLGILT